MSLKLKKQLEKLGETGELVRLPDCKGIKCFILHNGYTVDDVSPDSFIEMAELGLKIKNKQIN